jgi:hypothetical protein
MRRTLCVAGFCVAVALASGCGGDGPKYVPVSGVVTLDGKPYPNAFVSFQPKSSKENPEPGRGSMGLTDASGRFVLKYDGKDGALIGTHSIRIYTQSGKGVKQLDDDTGSPDGAAGDLDPIPMEWNEQSQKTFDVPTGGTDKANFDITSAKGAKKKK